MDIIKETKLEIAQPSSMMKTTPASMAPLHALADF
jgi:hypothetical protein